MTLGADHAITGAPQTEHPSILVAEDHISRRKKDTVAGHHRYRRKMCSGNKCAAFG